MLGPRLPVGSAAAEKPSDEIGQLHGLREDFSAEGLRSLARECTNHHKRGRLLAVAWMSDGVEPGDVARIRGISAPSLRQLLRRFDVSGIEALFDCTTEETSPPQREEGR
jgi:hypothetical protein